LGVGLWGWGRNTLVERIAKHANRTTAELETLRLPRHCCMFQTVNHILYRDTHTYSEILTHTHTHTHTLRHAQIENSAAFIDCI